MPPNGYHTAHAYAERIRARLPRVLQELREAAGMSRYALGKKCGVSRDMIGDIENGDSIPTLHFGARMAHGLGLKLWEFVRKLECHEAMKNRFVPLAAGACFPLLASWLLN